MKNADLPAMPFVEPDTACSIVTGLTKREMFAMHMMSALASQGNSLAFKDMASYACRMADALLVELDKKEAA